MIRSINEFPNVSVIVPTYKDWNRLQYCLDALSIQTYPHDLLEVIVINNDPSNDIPQLVCPRLSLTVIEESAPGSYAARNAGIQVCKGTVICFTDSDCIPKETWVERGVEELQKGTDRIAGKVELFYSDKRLTCAELYEKFNGFRQNYYVSEYGASATANLITFKRVFNDVGFFNPNLMSGGDIEWGMRASKKGFSIEYNADVVVLHPARSEFKELLRKRRRILGGKSVYGYVGRSYKSDIRLINFMIEAIRLLRGCTPPLKSISKIRDAAEISPGDKIKLFFVLYVLKIHSTWNLFLLEHGFRHPTRL